MDTLMKRNATVIAFFVILLLGAVGVPALAGLMESNEATAPEWVNHSHTEYYNDSFQFNSVSGMGHSSEETLNMTHNGSLNVTMDLIVYFHEPLFGDQGYVNVSLYEDDTLLFTNQTSESVIWNYSGVLNTTNLTVVVLSVGSDGTMTGAGVADYYILELEATVNWKELGE
jgi:hypothetical protein